MTQHNSQESAAVASTQCVYVVDDDEAMRDSMVWLIESEGYPVRAFPSAEDFLAAYTDGLAGCLVLDVRMPGMSGLELFDQLVARGLHQALPVIFLTGHADVPTAVDAVKRGAFDFCEKPFSDNALVDRIEQALLQSARTLAAQQHDALLRTRLTELTERERDVMRLVVEGMPNKLIADQLEISVRTVEVHRARVFDKMEVKSAVELANLLRGL